MDRGERIVLATGCLVMGPLVTYMLLPSMGEFGLGIPLALFGPTLLGIVLCFAVVDGGRVKLTPDPSRHHEGEAPPAGDPYRHVPLPQTEPDEKAQARSRRVRLLALIIGACLVLLVLEALFFLVRSLGALGGGAPG
jgi:hypothetical protein